MNARVHSFAPLSQPAVRTLVLGTMPGTASLAAHEYYAHPRNLFWTIFADLIGFPRDAPYADRVKRLIAADIAVWDVLKSCDRPGSLDSAIARTSIVANDFAEFFRRHPRIDRVFFNGTGAATLYRRHVLPTLADAARIEYVKLPSTSPANAGISADAKKRAWRVVLGSQEPTALQSD